MLNDEVSSNGGTANSKAMAPPFGDELSMIKETAVNNINDDSNLKQKNEEIDVLPSELNGISGGHSIEGLKVDQIVTKDEKAIESEVQSTFAEISSQLSKTDNNHNEVDIFFPNNSDDIISCLKIGSKTVLISNSSNQQVSIFLLDEQNKFQFLKTYTNPPFNKKYSTAFPIDNETIAVFGGNDSSKGLELWKINIFSTNPSWEQIRVIGQNIKSLYMHQTVSFLDHDRTIFFSFGGKCGSEFSNKLCLSILSDNLCICKYVLGCSSVLPSKRFFHSFTKIISANNNFGNCKNRFFLFGGISPDGSVLNDLWELDISLNGAMRPRWIKIDYLGISPFARFKHFSFSKESSLFIIGGINDKNEKFNDIWKFGNNEWQLISDFDSELSSNASSLFYVLCSDELFELNREKIAKIRLLFSTDYVNRNLYKKLLEKRELYLQERSDHINAIKSEKSFNILIKDNKIENNGIRKFAIDKIKMNLMKIKRENESSKLSELSFLRCDSVMNYYRNNLIDKYKQLQLKLNDIRQKNANSNFIFSQIQNNVASNFSSIPSYHLFPANCTSLENFVNKIDENHFKYLSYYYHLLQNRQYQENLKCIQSIKWKIEKRKRKYFIQNNNIVELMTNLNETGKHISADESETVYWQDKINEMKNEINSIQTKKLDEIIKELENIKEMKFNIEKTIKKEIVDVVNKKYIFQELNKLLDKFNLSLKGNTVKPAVKLIEENRNQLEYALDSI